MNPQPARFELRALLVVGVLLVAAQGALARGEPPRDAIQENISATAEGTVSELKVWVPLVVLLACVLAAAALLGINRLH